MSAKDIRNIVLLGHSGSGKTTLAERMLFLTGGTDRLGKIADGNTVCDYDPEEIRRQISISLAVAPVEYDSCKINVLDVPGGFDFAGEAAEAVQAADAAVIVCSAKAGISVGAEKAWKYCEKNALPRLIYISKIDEEHGDYYAVLSALKEKYGAAICPVMIPMSDGTGVIDLVHNTAYQTKGGKTTKIAVPAADADKVEELREALMETAAGATEELMEKYFDTMELTEAEMVTGIRAGLKDRSVVPVFASAAMAGVGTEALLQGIVDEQELAQFLRIIGALNAGKYRESH